MQSIRRSKRNVWRIMNCRTILMCGRSHAITIDYQRICSNSIVANDSVNKSIGPTIFSLRMHTKHLFQLIHWFSFLFVWPRDQHWLNDQSKKNQSHAFCFCARTAHTPIIHREKKIVLITPDNYDYCVIFNGRCTLPCLYSFLQDAKKAKIIIIIQWK